MARSLDTGYRPIQPTTYQRCGKCGEVMMGIIACDDPPRKDCYGCGGKPVVNYQRRRA